MSPTAIPGNLILQSPTANDPLLDLNTQPSLDLQFATSKTLNDRVSGQNLITFSRSTTGTYVDSNGIIQTAAIDAPRFDHDPATGESLGLLIEEARTNNIPNSVDLTAWSQQNGAVNSLSSAVTAPDGGTSSTLITVDSTGSYTQSPYAIPASTTACLSFFVKSAGLNVFVLSSSRSGSMRGHFDLTTGVWSNTVGDASDYSAVQFPNGWWKLTVRGFNAGTIAQYFLAGDSDISAGTPAFYFWGVQTEPGAFPTSYIPTSGSTVTRAADVASITGSNFSRWYNQSEGSWFVDSKCPVSPNNHWVFALNPSGTGEDVLYRGSTNTLRFLARYRGDVFDTNDAPSGQFNKASLGYELTAQASSYFNNASGVYSSIAGNTGTPTSLAFGLTPGNSVLNGHLSRLTYYPYRLPDATLQEITS